MRDLLHPAVGELRQLLAARGDYVRIKRVDIERWVFMLTLAQEAYLGPEGIELTVTERALYAELTFADGRIASIADLCKQTGLNERSLQTAITRFRPKLKKTGRNIRSIRKRGYAFTNRRLTW